MFDTIVRGMAYPYGSFNEDVLKALECAGIAYSRTVHSTGDFDIPTDWLKLSATCHHSDPKLFKYCDEFLFNSFKKPKLFYLWGHSYEFDDDNNWEVIEKFANKMGDKSDIWYATNIEIYNYVTAYNRLIFSVETHKVYNPNAIPIWFFCDYNNSKKIIKVDAGDTIDF